MGQQTWAFDAPTGTYKNHFMSAKIRHAAIVETKFMQFVDVEPGYGKGKGDTVTITRVANVTVPTNPRLTEGVRISEDSVSLTTVAITVTEFGRALPYTSLSDDLGKFDMSNIIQKALKDQMKVSLDNVVAAAMTSSSVKVKGIPDGIASFVFDTDGTASTQATVNLNMFHVEQIRDYLFSTLNTPPFSGDDYIGLVSTKGKRGIMNDPAWEQWHIYTKQDKKFNSELGRLENIRWIEINNINALSASLGASSVLGEAVIFGADFVTMAVAEDPELRVAMPGDFGRAKSIAWYGILEFGVVWDTANAGEARAVHVTSS